ncbi:ABC transporter ATP-binding protein [Actinokineospora sp.]|uniref:ABC transporter ATP-binding protein n=1 Tax=Actinokineospora sp. TaxID=1872133 RepID=UPI0040382A47
MTPDSPAGPPTAKAGSGTLRVLLGYARPHRAVLALTLVLTLAASASGLVQPLVAQDVLEALGSDASLLGPILLLGALVVAGAVLTGMQSWLQQRTSERVVRQVRRGLIDRLIRLRVSELDRRPPGDLIARVTADSTLLQNAATDGLILVANGSLTFVGAVVLMGTVHFGLLAVTLTVLVVVAVVMTLVLPRIRAAVARAQESVGAIGAALDRTLGAARTVKANGAEGRETALADLAVEDAYEAGLVGARYRAVVQILSGMSIQAAFLVVLGFGGALVAAGDLSAPALIAFLLYVFFLANPIASLVSGLSQLQQGLGAVGRIAEVADMRTEDDVDATLLPPAGRKVAPTIEFDGVEFSYFGRSPALRGISYTVPGGTQTALVGLSGAGKTTMFALLQKFYEPSAGTIRIDGVDIATLTRAEVRRRIAYVEQDTPVMAGTIRDNLRYAAPEATDAEIAQALRVTYLDTLVDRLDAGLDTEVGTRGVALSGGERQRLVIARALLRKPEVLLLDEATAQLDARNEQALRDTITQAAEYCTVVLIAHRLSTVTAVDQIVMLEHGRVRALGTHSELVRSDDLYRELAATQLLAGDDAVSGQEDLATLTG